MRSDEINPKNIEKYHKKIDIEGIKKLSMDRISNNELVKLIEEQAKIIKENSQRESITLNLDAYVAENELHSERINRVNEQVNKYKFNLKVLTVKEDALLAKRDTVFKVKMQNWQKSIVKDVYIDEAVNVLDDLSK